MKKLVFMAIAMMLAALVLAGHQQPAFAGAANTAVAAAQSQTAQQSDVVKVYGPRGRWGGGRGWGWRGRGWGWRGRGWGPGPYYGWGWGAYCPWRCGPWGCSRVCW